MRVKCLIAEAPERVCARDTQKTEFHCGATESSGRGVHQCEELKSTRGCIYPPHTDVLPGSTLQALQRQ